MHCAAAKGQNQQLHSYFLTTFDESVAFTNFQTIYCDDECTGNNGLSKINVSRNKRSLSVLCDSCLAKVAEAVGISKVSEIISAIPHGLSM